MTRTRAGNLIERFDLTSLENRLLRRAPLPQNDLPVASVAVIINPEDRGGSLLLIKRTEREGDPWSGQIGFPGGHKSPSDQDFLQTAIRETEEEVGIVLSQHLLLGSLPLVTTLSRRVQVAPFVFALKSIAAVQLNREVAENFWMPLSDLMRLEVKRRKVQVEKADLEVDSYDYQGRIIWGLTFRILNLLLNRRLEDRS
jgi:8-oxo-dGTP pyrophosphatase MutT (NUDIX family)